MMQGRVFCGERGFFDMAAMASFPLARRNSPLRLILVACAVLLAACSARPDRAAVGPEDSAGPPADRSPVTEAVTLTYWEEEPDDGDVLLDGLTAEFMAAHPLVTVARVHLSYEELLDRVARGGAPDLARCASECAGPLSVSGQFLPAGELFDPVFLERFLPGAIEAARIKGAAWGVPDNTNNFLLLIYNPNLVEAPPSDTEAWIAELRTLTNADEDRWGLAYFLDEPYWLAPWIGGFGGWFVDEMAQPTLDTQPVIEALRFVRRLRLDEQVTPPQADYDMALDYFKQGRAAYLIDGDWSLDRLREAGMAFGVAPLPRVSATGLAPTPLASGKHWFIGRSSEASPAKRVAVKAFVEWMTAAQAQNRWLEKARRLPSDAAAAASPVITTDPIRAGEMAQLRQSRGLPAAPEMRCVWRAMRPGLEAVMAGATSPQAASHDMQAVATACISARRFK
jgi:arabinogalactan oligomer/maltooligosaccharide transport system substrate-binding protein